MIVWLVVFCLSEVVRSQGAFASTLPANACGTNGRLYSSATSLGSLALFPGGAAQGQSLNTLCAFNATSFTWSNYTMPAPVQDLAAVTLHNFALFAGGYDAGNNFYSNAIEQFDALSGVTTSYLTLSAARARLAGVAFGTLALFAGGSDATQDYDTVDAYGHDGLGFTSQSVFYLSQARRNLAATTLGTLAFFAGGDSIAGGVYYDNVDIYDYNSQSWSVYYLSTQRASLTATTVGTVAMFAGGLGASGADNAVDIFDYSIQSWYTGTLSVGRYNLASTSIGTIALFAGGSFDPTVEAATSLVDIYDATTSQWATDTLPQDPVSNFAATTVNDVAVFAGGQNATVPLQQAEYYQCNACLVPAQYNFVDTYATYSLVKLVERINGVDNIPYSPQQFNDFFNYGKRIIRLDIPGEKYSYVFYKRLYPYPDGFDLYSNIFDTWSSSLNAQGYDFEMYSTYQDLVYSSRPWSCSTYDQPGVGFPAGCVGSHFGAKKRGENLNDPFSVVASWQSLQNASIYAFTSDSCYLYPQALYSARGSPYPDILAQLTAGQPYLELSFIDFMTCTDCNGGTQINAALSMPNNNYFYGGCPIQFGYCYYTCQDKTGAGNFTQNSTGGFGPNQVTALSSNEEKLGYIYDLLAGNAFLNSIRKAFPNTTIQFYPIFNATGSLIGIGINTTDCSNFPQVALFISGYLAFYAPPLDFQFVLDGCTSNNNDQLSLLALLALLAIPLLLLFLLWRHLRSREFIQNLPPQVAWSYLQYKDSLGFGWKKYFGGSANCLYYYKDYSMESAEWNKVEKLFGGFFFGEGLVIDEIRAVYNPTLLNNFINYWKLTTSRYLKEKDVFFAEDFKNNELQMWTLSKYENVVKACSWNKSLYVPILPSVHGTDFALAEKIAQTGFANLSSLDDGYFGKGIYFSTMAVYIVPYFCLKITPAIIISYLNLGHVYPVCESHVGSESLKGEHIKAGFSSHYIVVQKHGFTFPSPVSADTNTYDEIVIDQEAQIVPAFILKINHDSAKEMAREFDDLDLRQRLTRKEKFAKVKELKASKGKSDA